MNKDLAQQAVSQALAGNWKKAIEFNSLILKDNSEDIDALNRLARAHAELGNIKKARSTAQKVIKLDHFNSIAIKSLAKWEGLKQGETIKSGPSSAKVFLEEPGKTKLVKLLHPCGAKVLARLDAGDEVKINTYAHRITVTTPSGTYIGKLPDDLSVHLRKLIKYGNEYNVLIKSTDACSVKIFIRETKRSKKLANIPSFSTEKIEYISFTPPELVHKKIQIHEIDEEENE